MLYGLFKKKIDHAGVKTSRVVLIELIVYEEYTHEKIDL